ERIHSSGEEAANPPGIVRRSHLLLGPDPQRREHRKPSGEYCRQPLLIAHKGHRKRCITDHGAAGAHGSQRDQRESRFGRPCQFIWTSDELVILAPLGLVQLIAISVVITACGGYMNIVSLLHGDSGSW